MKREFTVYRMDYARGKKEPIGCILERRGSERGNNLLDLLKKARKLFGHGPSDAFHIVIDSPKNSRKIIAPDIVGGIASIVMLA